MDQKLLVLGLDGASWNLLKPWIEEGHLPNIAKIREKGFSGNLESTYPYVTFPAWKTYSTGRNPAKLGVYYWFNFDRNDGKLDFTDSTDFWSKEIWDYLSDNNIASGIINMPSTYPPKEVEGFMVSGTLASEEDDYTYPAELKKQIKGEGYKVNPSAEKNTEEWLDELKELLEIRTDLAVRKLEEVDFMHLTFFYTDKIQHNYWNGEEALDFWKKVDEQIERILERDINLILMSDHGFQKMDRFFFVNTWLEKEGYLRRSTDMGDTIQKAGLNRDKIFAVVEKLGVQEVLRILVPKYIRRKIPRSNGVVEETDIAAKIDFKNSKAFALSEGPLYIIEENVEDLEKFRKELKFKLENLEEGEIVDKVINAERIYHGQYQDSAPDLFLDQAKGVEIRMDLSDNIVSEDFSASSWIANHRQNGIYAAYGRDFSQGNRELQIYDLMPTILNYYNVEIPADVDGEVITEIYSERSGIKDKQVKRDNNLDDLDI